MKLRLSNVIVVMLVIIGIGVIVVAAAGLVQWFLNHFWIILVTGAVIIGFLIWLKIAEKEDQNGDDS